MTKDVDKLLAASQANCHVWIIVHMRPVMLLKDVLCEDDIEYLREKLQ